MSQTMLDVFFRHKFLILLPLVILLLLGVVASMRNVTTVYSSSAKIWAQRTPLLSSRLAGQGGAFTTPAGQQALVLRDLLSFTSFRQLMAENVPSLQGLPPGLQARVVGEGTRVSGGVHVLTIRNENPDPILARDIVQAVIDTYAETFQSRVVTEADEAMAFYEQWLDEVALELDEAQAELATYQEQISPGTAVFSSDPEFEILTGQVRRAQSEYDSLLDRLRDIHLQRDAALKGRDLSFQVMDPPEVPTTPLPTPKKDMILMPALGLLLGLSASGGLLFALTRLDDSIRLPAEARRLGLPVLSVIPELGRERKRSWPQHFVRLVVASSRGLIGGLR